MTTTCGHVRDLYPEWPGSVLLICDRRPHKGGRHAQHNSEGRVTVEWWGDKCPDCPHDRMLHVEASGGCSECPCSVLWLAVPR